MNIERLIAVREQVLLHKNGFNYSKILENRNDGNDLHDAEDIMNSDLKCNTIGCVAGWTLVAFKDILTLLLDTSDDFSRLGCAQNILELTDREADWLFVPWSNLPTVFYSRTLEEDNKDGLLEALRRLDWLIEHESIEGYISPLMESMNS